MSEQGETALGIRKRENEGAWITQTKYVQKFHKETYFIRQLLYFLKIKKRRARLSAS